VKLAEITCLTIIAEFFFPGEEAKGGVGNFFDNNKFFFWKHFILPCIVLQVVVKHVQRLTHLFVFAWRTENKSLQNLGMMPVSSPRPIMLQLKSTG